MGDFNTRIIGEVPRQRRRLHVTVDVTQKTNISVAWCRIASPGVATIRADVRLEVQKCDAKGPDGLRCHDLGRPLKVETQVRTRLRLPVKDQLRG